MGGIIYLIHSYSKKFFRSWGLFLFLSLLLITIPFNINATEIKAKSNITQVTCFPRGASIVREAHLNLTRGHQTIIFSDLPASLEDNSLHLEGEGQVGVKILNLEVDRIFLSTPLQQEVKQLENKIRTLDENISQLEEKLNILFVKEKFLQSIAEGSSVEAWKQIIAGTTINFQNWQKTLDFLGEQLTSIAQEKIATSQEIVEKKEEREALQKKLELLKPRQSQEAKKVSVLAEVTEPGEVTLRLSYLTREASWAPRYTLRALTEENRIDLNVLGVVQQHSGENWDNISLSLSTSTPTAGNTPPQLNPWFLDIYTPPPPSPREKGIVGGVVGGVVGGRVEAAPQKVSLDLALIEEKGLHLNFKIPRASSIPSDNQPHTVPIDNQKLAATFDYFSIPKKAEAAFLRASFENSLAYPLLDGHAHLFIDEDYIGQTRLTYLAPGDKGEFFFGEDRQVEIKYNQVEKKKITPGFLSKTEKIRYTFRINIQNFRPQKIKLEILDQLPVSRNSKITLEDIEFNPQPNKQEETGILHWQISLDPQEKKEITIGFTIAYPQGSRIIGL